MPRSDAEFPADFSAPHNGASPAPEAAPDSVFFHELSLNLGNIRNPEILNFINQHNFIPYYWREITVANKKFGLADVLHEARYSNNNANNPVENQIRAAEKTYESAEKYVAKSAESLADLRLAFKDGQTSPSPQEIRSNPQIIDVIANFILTFRKIEAEYWPAWNAEILASALEQIKDRLMTVSDEEAVALWDMARLNNNERLKFWSGQLSSVKGNRIVRELMGLREARQNPQSAEPSIAQAEVEEAEYDDETEAETTEALDDERPGWQTSVLPNGQIMIEGTDVELVTDAPVARRPRKKTVKASETEALFDSPGPDKLAGKSAASKHKPRPYRARFSDTTDYSVRALREGLEGKPDTDSNPDADLDEIFGQAAR